MDINVGETSGEYRLVRHIEKLEARCEEWRQHALRLRKRQEPLEREFRELRKLVRDFERTARIRSRAVSIGQLRIIQIFKRKLKRWGSYRTYQED